MEHFDPATASCQPIVREGPDERDYLLARAAFHQQRAVIAQDKTSSDIHLTLHRLYEERAAAIRLVQHD